MTDVVGEIEGLTDVDLVRVSVTDTVGDPLVVGETVDFIETDGLPLTDRD